MARDLALTFSCGDDEIVRALEEGIVKPQGIDLEVVVMDSRARYVHRQGLAGREITVDELFAEGA